MRMCSSWTWVGRPLTVATPTWPRLVHRVLWVRYCWSGCSADPRDLSLNRTKEDLVNLMACVSQSKHCRTYQAVRDGNHGVAHQRYQFGPQAGRRSQNAADDDAAANYSGPRHIRRLYRSKQVRKGR